jgi:hypothetical protein
LLGETELSAEGLVCCASVNFYKLDERQSWTVGPDHDLGTEGVKKTGSVSVYCVGG